MCDLSLQVVNYNGIRLAQFLVAAFLSWRFSAFYYFSLPLLISAQIATRHVINYNLMIFSYIIILSLNNCLYLLEALRGGVPRSSAIVEKTQTMWTYLSSRAMEDMAFLLNNVEKIRKFPYPVR